MYKYYCDYYYHYNLQFNDIFYNICGVTFLKATLNIEVIKKSDNYGKYYNMIYSGKIKNDEIEGIV